MNKQKQSVNELSVRIKRCAEKPDEGQTFRELSETK